ncbi:MAG: hypothetical protein R6U32_02855 [Candidatus Woesearchaeota archaeon]
MHKKEGVILLLAWALISAVMLLNIDSPTGRAISECQPDDTYMSADGELKHCDYCKPEWKAVNTSCRKDDTITQYFTDENDCFWRTGLASDNNRPANNTYPCDYCTPDLIERRTNCYDGKRYVFQIDTRGCYNRTGLLPDLPPPRKTRDCSR